MTWSARPSFAAFSAPSAADYKEVLDRVQDATDIGLTHRARATGAQSIPNITDTQISFPTVDSSTTLVTATGSNTFTLNRAGIWAISASIRFVSGTNGERLLYIAVPPAHTLWLMGQTVVSSIPTSLSVSSTCTIVAGSSLSVYAYQSSGGALNTDATFVGTNNVSFTWLGYGL